MPAAGAIRRRRQGNREEKMAYPAASRAEGAAVTGDLRADVLFFLEEDEDPRAGTEPADEDDADSEEEGDTCCRMAAS